MEALGKVGMEGGVGDSEPEQGAGCAQGAALPGWTTMGLQWDSGNRVPEEEGR